MSDGKCTVCGELSLERIGKMCWPCAYEQTKEDLARVTAERDEARAVAAELAVHSVGVLHDEAMAKARAWTTLRRINGN